MVIGSGSESGTPLQIANGRVFQVAAVLVIRTLSQPEPNALLSFSNCVTAGMAD